MPNYNPNMAMATSSGFKKNSRSRINTPKRNRIGQTHTDLLYSPEPSFATDAVSRNRDGLPEIAQNRTGAQASFFAMNGKIQPD